LVQFKFSLFFVEVWFSSPFIVEVCAFPPRVRGLFEVCSIPPLLMVCSWFTSVFTDCFFSSVQFAPFLLVLISFNRSFFSFLEFLPFVLHSIRFHRKICPEPPLQLEDFQETARNKDNKAKFDAR